MDFLPKPLKVFICVLIVIVFIPIRVFSAEVLQVTSSSVLQIGDKNRNYQVKIFGIDIYSFKEKEATSWLREKLPRSSKVNLLPKGYEDGTLISEVIDLKSGEDISTEMIKLGFSKKGGDL